jgi:hypothetical protein
MQRYAFPNTAPVLATIGSKSTPELQTLNFTAEATEAANNFGDTITFILTGTPPSGASINPKTGLFSWTPTEAQGPGPYTVTVQALDNGEPALADIEPVTITVSEVNVAPTGLQLSSNIVQSGAPVGTVIGTISAMDSDLPAQTLTYSLVSGTGSTDNANFNISGNQLQVAVPPNIHTKAALSIRVQVADTFTGTAQQQFTITVQPASAVGEWQVY